MYSSATYRVILLVFLATAFGCSKSYRVSKAEYNLLRITAASPKDQALERMLAPYADSVNSSMNKIIGEVAVDLEKKLPEGSLNNLLADAMLAEARLAFGNEVAAAFVNYGGVRATQLPAGPLTIGKVFELMPFDNLLIVQELSGATFQSLLDNIAERGGWPCAGVQFTIKNNKAIDVLIGGQPLDVNARYLVANSDYVANGGDESNMLRTIPQMNKGVLVRDAFLHYFESLTATGQKISATVENRIRYAQ